MYHGSKPSHQDGETMRVLVLGGSVIGTSVAYRLASRGVGVVVIECRTVAYAASSKAGRFLALDWCDGTPLMPLARRNFALHAKLAEELEGDWGYRRMTTFAGTVGDPAVPTRHVAKLGWVSSEVAINHQLGSTGTTAQVHPAAFTAAMMHAAEKRGATLRTGRATALLRRSGNVTGV